MVAFRVSELGVPTRFGPYRLGRTIGAGGMAIVYAARQETTLGTARLVALKILNEGTALGPDGRAQFVREAALSTRLEHPGIVRTYDVGEIDGRLYMAMELVRGATLNAVEAPVAPAIATRVIAHLAEALHYAHDTRGAEGRPLGIVHQDVTPHNIIVGYDGRVRLLDFGVARLAEVDASRTDSVRGKPAYLSPEQLEGQGIDRRVDVFALGIVLYELLTATRLFRRDTVARTFRAVLVDPIPDVREIRPDVPEALAAIVARALRRDKAARWASAQELARALHELVTSGVVAAKDDADVAAWIASVAPPSFEYAELERELEDTRAASLSPDVTAPTVDEAIPISVATVEGPKGERASTPGRQSGSVSTQITPELLEKAGISQRSRVWPVVAFVATVLVLLVAAATVRAIRNARNAAMTASTAHGPSSATPTPTEVASIEPPPVDTVAATAPSASASTVAPPSRQTHTRSTAAPSAPASSPPLPAASSAVATSPPANGYLYVWSRRWGHVAVDGRSVGDSPIDRVPLSPGSHTVRITVDGAPDQVQTINVEPDKDARVRFTF